MPKLNSFELIIRTGEKPLESTPTFIINGFPLDFEQVEGSTGVGDTLRATGSPESFPHTLLLHGPEEGEWEITEIRATYFTQGEEPYHIRFGRVLLDDKSDLNIWAERPLPTFDV